jgi:hypothetical protein
VLALLEDSFELNPNAIFALLQCTGALYDDVGGEPDEPDELAVLAAPDELDELDELAVLASLAALASSTELYTCLTLSSRRRFPLVVLNIMNIPFFLFSKTASFVLRLTSDPSSS